MPAENDAAVAERAREPMAFFSHDSHAASDIKCRRLIRRFGMEGYGRWWLLCELLAAAEGHSLPFGDDEDALILAETLRFSGGGSFDERIALDECRKFVEGLVDIGLLSVTPDGGIESERMTRNAAYFGKNRANGAKGGRPRKKGAETDGCRQRKPERKPPV